MREVEDAARAAVTRGCEWRCAGPAPGDGRARGRPAPARAPRLEPVAPRVRRRAPRCHRLPRREDRAGSGLRAVERSGTAALETGSPSRGLGTGDVLVRTQVGCGRASPSVERRKDQRPPPHDLPSREAMPPDTLRAAHAPGPFHALRGPAAPAHHDGAAAAARPAAGSGAAAGGGGADDRGGSAAATARGGSALRARAPALGGGSDSRPRLSRAPLLAGGGTRRGERRGSRSSTPIGPIYERPFDRTRRSGR